MSPRLSKNFSPSHGRETVDWVTVANTDTDTMPIATFAAERCANFVRPITGTMSRTIPKAGIANKYVKGCDNAQPAQSEIPTFPPNAARAYL